MATTHGKDGAVYIGSDQVAEVSAFTLNQSADTAEATAMGDSAAKFKVGITRGDGSITCHWDDSDTTGQGAMTVGSQVSLKLYPEGNTTGKVEYSMSAWITSASVSVSMGDIVSREYAFSIDGVVTEGTVA